MKTPEEMALEAFTIDDIRSWKPCYDPSRYLSEGWAGTAIDILKHESIPSQDKLWVVCREEVLNARTLRLFAVWCARQVEYLITDERSKQAIMVAEQYALGNATKKQLDVARAAAGEAAGAARTAAWEAAGAARAAAWDAAGAAWAAAWEAAGAAGAARAAAWEAAGAAAWEAAGAARGAAWEAAGAARAAAGEAADAARAAAGETADAARAAQVAQLLKMLEEK